MPSENSAVTSSPTPTNVAGDGGGGGNNKGAAAVSPNGKFDEGSDAKSPMSSPNTSFDPTEYVQKQRVTKTTPPKPAYNPLQFIQIKPCNLYQSAQDQLRKAEEVKKAKVTKKEDAEDWQGNLDSWKSSRRKRVEHIIERVVEVKKLEIEEHDRTRKKSKTFSEMMEERGGRRKISVPVYTEDESNDLSDLGIGTSSASGKSSMSEDFDNHSVISDNPDIDHHDDSNGRRNVSSPGYETSSSTAPTTSPDPLDYHNQYAVPRPVEGPLKLMRKASLREATPEPNKFLAKRPSVTKIEDRLVNFELKSSASESSEVLGNGHAKKDLPKVDILKRREMFEKEQTPDRGNRSSGDFTQAAPMMSIKERLSNLERQKEEGNHNSAVASNRLSGDITSIKDRLKNLEKEKSTSNGQSGAAAAPKFDVPLGGSIKDRLSSLHSATTPPADDDAVLPASAKAAVVVAMAKKPRPVIDQVVEVESLQIEIEQIQLTTNRPGPLSVGGAQSVMMTQEGSIQDAVQDYGTIMQDVKEKEEYREITDEDLFGGTDIEMEIDSLQQDMSVLEALDIAFEAIDKDGDGGGGGSGSGNDTQTESEKNATCNLTTASHDDRVATNDSGHAVAASTITATASTTNPATQSATDIMDNDKDIERFIDDLIKQINGDTTDQAIDALVDEGDETDGEHGFVEAPQPTLEPTIKPVVIEEKRIVFEVNVEPIYEIIEDVSQPKPLKSALKSPSKAKKEKKREPAVEPYYEVPNRKPIPLYENVDIFLASVNDTNQGQLLSTIPAGVCLEPPKMKPPPPPIDSESEGGEDDAEGEEDEESVVDETPEENLKRMNSTKRIKKDIRNKRSSFLGIESTQDDDLDLKLSIAPPPDMSALIEEERRLEKQFLRTYDGVVERSDSGVSESHSRQSSEPFTGSSEEQDDRSKELEDVAQHREWGDDVRMQNIEEQIREQEEVLRVERELLQIEQEELKRQRANLLLRENFARKELDHGSKMLLSANRLSLQDINQNMAVPNGHQMPSSHLSSSTSSTTSSTFNVPAAQMTYSVRAPNSVPIMDYRQSMPNLHGGSAMLENGGSQQFVHSTGHATITPMTPPAKPSRQLDYLSNSTSSAHPNDHDFVQLRDHQNNATSTNQPGNMSRHTLHALSAVPKPKLTDVWVQQQATTVARSSESNINNININNNKYFPIQRKAPIAPSQDQWIARKPDAPKGLGFGKHWLIQEAEQRRLDQQRGVRPTPNPQNWPIKSAGHLHRKSMPDISGEKKPLPDAVINTITQRLQSRMSVGSVVDKRRFDANPAIINSNPSLDEGLAMDHAELRHRNQEQVLSVSGKKKCSHCDEELGRGAAMIVESLRLFYHIDCFKCCVCLVRLGDGMNGTDVRVRNHKLHCQNCYSSDDGIKFSCV